MLIEVLDLSVPPSMAVSTPTKTVDIDPTDYVLDGHEGSLNLVKKTSLEKYKKDKTFKFEHETDFYRLRSLTIHSTSTLKALGWCLKDAK